MYEKQMNNFIILFVLFVRSIESYPIEVTGKNISYYKLTPNEGSGSYNFDYGTPDGAQRSERGFVKHHPDHAEPLLVVTGSFKHPDGKEVFYIADEQGYRIVTKTDIDDLHNELPNEILPTKKQATIAPGNSISSKPVSSKSISSKPISSSISPKPVASALSATTPVSATTLKNFEEITRSKIQMPVTESQLIKVNIIKPVSDKVVTCAPGICSGARESKIFKIKPIKIG